MVKTISKESKDLAIEFSEWIIEYCEIEELNIYYDDFRYTTDELFNKFLEEKYNGEIQDI